MVITESPSPIPDPSQNQDFRRLAQVHKVLGNPTRLAILCALESSSLSFTEMMKSLELNPKTLSSALGLLGRCGLVRKSYPHQVYVITPLGRRVIREQVLALQEALEPAPFFERGTG
jgi:DNA-binding HxlR family transcriptional regulator